MKLKKSINVLFIVLVLMSLVTVTALAAGEAVQVTSISVASDGNVTTTTAGTPLQFTATVLPADAGDPSVTWSVVNGTGTATITDSGVLTGVSAGTVTVRATSNDGSGVYGELPVTVKSIPGTVWNGTVDTTWYAGTTGTYTINTAEELAGLAYLVNSGNTFSSSTVSLGADINLNDELFNTDGELNDVSFNEWTSIGNNSTPFRGNFNGGGYIISGLYQNVAADADLYAGLFGYVYGSISGTISISAVTLKDCSISAASSASYYAYTGGIAGDIYWGTISNCSFSGTVTGTHYTGGIAGYNQYSAVSNCSNSGSICSTTTNSYSDAGGICGSITGMGNDAISDCHNTGSVNAYYAAGGISGTNRIPITNCYNTGRIYASSDAGGIAGQDYSTIENCYNTGNIITVGNSSYSGYSGGIAGDLYGTVRYCYNTGYISAAYTSQDTFLSSYSGGIAGYIGNSNSIVNSYNIGGVYADYAGGIVGTVGSSCSFNGCYYLDRISKGVGRGSDAMTALTEEQMRSASSFDQFDFNTYWTMAGNETYLYPELQSVGMVSSASSDFAGGSGMAYDPYQITSKQQLDSVRNYSGSYFILDNDITFTEADFAEGGSFYNSGEGWKAIGTKMQPFAGVFDGNGKTISGLYQKITTSAYGGLFGYADHATIQNLKLADSKASVTSSGESLYVGGIAGYFRNSVISNCTYAGSVSATSTYDYCYAGGIIGCTDGSTIDHCDNSGSVYAQTSEHETSVGGISGVGGPISYCSNTGEVTSISTSTSSMARAGGISGDAGTIRNCSNSGTITATAPGISYAGGIAGRGTTVSNSGNVGTINATTTDSNAYAGGIAGAAYDISTCYNSGQITATPLKPSGTIMAGGIVGCDQYYTTCTIDNCYNIGEINTDGYWGGILGRYSDSKSSSLTITNCYDVGGIYHAILGNNSSYLTNCSITSCYYLDNSTGGISESTGAAKGLSSVEMVQENSFTSFGKYISTEDLKTSPNDVWVFIHGNYPVLYWQDPLPSVKYGVSFDANGGKCDTDYVLVSVDAAYGELPTPSRTGYTFEGWYTAASGGNLISADTLHTQADDQTLYAHWKANTYTVSFDADGVDVSPASKIVTYNGTYGTLPTPTRTGYSFEGWYSDKCGTVTASTIVTVAADDTLHAHWDAIYYKVFFDPNGGAMYVGDAYVVAYGTTFGTIMSTPTRSDYKFLGWYTAASGGTQVTETATVMSDQTLYAHWELCSLNGVDYSAVYDYNYYIAHNPDVAAAFNGDELATLKHFVNYGMSEGRQAIATFNVYSYKLANPDLRAAFGSNLKAYYLHYINYGKNEGRTATGVTQLIGAVTKYNGVDYSAVYDYNYYIAHNPDVKAAFGLDDAAVLQHFVKYGMSEGRQAIATFDVNSYKLANPDLRVAFGSNLKAYYLHYINYGKNEGRTATGVTQIIGAVTKYNGVDYSAVYDYNYYIAHNPDVKAAFGLDDAAVLNHFIKYGMSEGRQAIATFDVNSYKLANPDLRAAFGSNLKAYYLHYINYGKNEGRTATGVTQLIGAVTKYNGVDYSAVYDYNYYIAHNPDVKAAFGGDELATLNHFINYGMSEGRQAIATFNVNSYRAAYTDLQTAFGSNLKAYYLHYINYGKNEGRTATGTTK